MLKYKGKLFVASILLIVLTVVIIIICICVNNSNSQIYQLDMFSEQINKYLNTNGEPNIKVNNIKSKFSSKYSTEGANFFAIYSDDYELQYFSVDICGEMGKQIHEYTFAKEHMIYSFMEVAYAEPFYMNPDDVKIQQSNYKKYLICNGQMYDCTFDQMAAVSKEFQEDTISIMVDFVKTLNEND